MPTFLARTARVSAACLGLAAVSAIQTADAQDAPRKTFSSGKLLTAEEFQQEQAYHRGNRGGASAFGQLSGLTVAVDGSAIKIAPGFAVTPGGEKVVLPNMLRLDTPLVDGKRYAVVCAILRDLGRRCLLLAVVEREGGRVRVERAGPG
jgi:hypothetical protein